MNGNMYNGYPSILNTSTHSGAERILGMVDIIMKAQNNIVKTQNKILLRLVVDCVIVLVILFKSF